MSGSAEIRRVQSEGKTFRTRYLSVRVCAAADAHIRVGLIVPRFGKTAVERNRLKRRFREAIRVHFLPGAPAVDVLIRASKRAYELGFPEVRDEVSRVTRFVAGS